jgi:predicted HAD superfamily Cof-like phosphohydrolase
MTEFEDVRAFHEKFSLLAHDAPVHLTRRKLAERANFMLEELKEFADAAGLVFDPEKEEFRPSRARLDQDLELQADALVDIAYVVLGTAVQLGLPWSALWDDVQRANLAKVRGDSDRTYIDVVKPPGWEPPRTEAVLREAGYNRDDWDFPTGQINEQLCKDDK